jgi:general secretion pathway protein K
VINPNGSPNEVMIDRLRRLFERVQVDPRLVDKLVDWIDSDQLTSGPDGAEDAVYLGLSPAMRPSNRPISSVSTLLFLPGMDSEKMARLKPYLAALPVGSKLNVCTAKAAVLASIATSLSVFAQDDKALATQRRSGCFPRLQDIQPYLTQAAGANPNSLNLLSADLAENSNYFQVQSTITQGGFALRALSELWVQTDGSSVVLRRSIGWD